MTREEAMKIIKEENLNHYNFFEDKDYDKYELTIQKVNEKKWIVCGTDERASVFSGSESFFESESDALENFIRRLRAGKRLEERTGGRYR